MPNRDERELERLEAECLARWRAGETLSTLDLRSAAHGAINEIAADDLSKLTRELREAVDK